MTGHSVARDATACRICAEMSNAFGQARVLSRHDVRYYRCNHCGFVQTEEPYWLADAYSSAITDSDIGLVGRSISFSRMVRNLIYLFLNRNGRFLDFGAGYGLFVRMMRDYGLDFRWSDEKCENRFAKGFEGNLDGGDRYDLVTAIEVFEHLVDPMPAFARILTSSDALFFTTVLVPEPPPSVGTWWYYGLEHGQHISLFSARSLAYVAQKFDLHLQSDGVFIHLLTRNRVSPRALPAVKSAVFGVILNPILDRVAAKRSFLNRDFAHLTGHKL
jgi:Methyltransferase domain